MTALLMVGCGSSTSNHGAVPLPGNSTATLAALQRAHPHVVQPVAGQARATAPTTGRPIHTAPASPVGAPAFSAPASVTRAPSKGAPTDAEVRAAIARFQAAVARYHLDRLNLSGALLNPSALPPGQYFTSIASVYTDYGLPVACGGVLHVPELGVANKTLPCGTEVIFRYGGRAIRVPVIDRGPYIAGREWDLTGATAEALHFPGLGPIQWRLG